MESERHSQEAPIHKHAGAVDAVNRAHMFNTHTRGHACLTSGKERRNGGVWNLRGISADVLYTLHPKKKRSNTQYHAFGGGAGQAKNTSVDKQNQPTPGMGDWWFHVFVQTRNLVFLHCTVPWGNPNSEAQEPQGAGRTFVAGRSSTFLCHNEFRCTSCATISA